MAAGLLAGALSAVIAVLVSLPLRSPSDTLFNSASVALAGLLAGALAGLLWAGLRRRRAASVVFLVVWTAVFAPIALAVVLYGRGQLDHFTAFSVPLALIIYGVTGGVTVASSRFLPNLRWWWVAAAVIVALAVGLGLAGQGDQPGGELELPPPSSGIIR